jgi:NADPH:quinone reductase-like Zn-dependent oxidoreductase
VIAFGRADDAELLYRLGADEVGDYDAVPFERTLEPVDVVLDTVAGDLQARSFGIVKPGGILISIVEPPDQKKAAEHHIRAVFFIADVTSNDMVRIAEMLTTGEIVPCVGIVIPLGDAKRAYRLLEERQPGLHGKIVLSVND